MSKTAHELTRKEMKGPDRFQQVASEAAGWLAKRQKVVGAVAAAAALVAILAVASSYAIDSRRAKAGDMLYRALDAAGSEVSSVPLPNSDRPLYKTNQEKQQAVLAATAQLEQQAGGSKAAIAGHLLAGDAHLALGEWDAAVASYRRFLDKAAADDALRYVALDGIARAQEGKGDLGAAIAAYETATGAAPFQDRARLELARVLVKAGKADEARKALAAVPADSALHVEAQERLTRLGAK